MLVLRVRFSLLQVCMYFLVCRIRKVIFSSMVSVSQVLSGLCLFFFRVWWVKVMVKLEVISRMVLISGSFYGLIIVFGGGNSFGFGVCSSGQLYWKFGQSMCVMFLVFLLLSQGLVKWWMQNSVLKKVVKNIILEKMNQFMFQWNEWFICVLQSLVWFLWMMLLNQLNSMQVMISLLMKKIYGLWDFLWLVVRLLNQVFRLNIVISRLMLVMIGYLFWVGM